MAGVHHGECRWFMSNDRQVVKPEKRAFLYLPLSGGARVGVVQGWSRCFSVCTWVVVALARAGGENDEGH